MHTPDVKNNKQHLNHIESVLSYKTDMSWTHIQLADSGRSLSCVQMFQMVFLMTNQIMFHDKAINLQ